MLLLCFETSAKACSAALHDGERLLGESYQNTGLTHSQTLMVMAEDLLKQCGKTAADVTALAVAAGPGSFTGVRIGVSAAKGFAWGREIPCYGVSTLEAMARSAACLGGVICCCMDARRAQVYNAVFERCGETLVRLREDRAISLDDLCEDLQNIEKTIFLVGDGAELCYTTLLERLPRLTLLPEHLRQQRASGAALAAWEKIGRGERGDAGSLTPNYLRLSQAERARLEKTKTE